MITAEIEPLSRRLLQDERAKGEERLTRVRVVVLSLVTVVQFGFLFTARPSDYEVQVRAVFVFGIAAVVSALWWWVYRRRGLFRGAVFISTSFDVAVATAITLNWSLYPGVGVVPTQLKFAVGYGALLGALVLTAVRFDYRSVLLATAEVFVVYLGLILLVAAATDVRFVWEVNRSHLPDALNLVDLGGRLTVVLFVGGLLAYGNWRVDRMLQQSVRVMRQKQKLGQFVSQRVAEAIESGEARLDLSGQRRRIAILFCDIRGFTRLSESLEPEALLELLNRYYELAAEEVFRHHGTLDKYLGDGFMALFGAPTPLESPSRAAVACALALLEKVRDFRGPGGETLAIGVGIHTDEVVVGNLGTEAYKSYTAVGRGVNMAARIESATAGVEASLLFSEAVRDALDGEVAVEPAGTFELKGIAEPQPLFTARRAADEA